MPAVGEEYPALDERQAALRAEKPDRAPPAYQHRNAGEVVIAPHVGSHSFDPGYVPSTVLEARRHLNLYRANKPAHTEPDPWCEWCLRWLAGTLEEAVVGPDLKRCRCGRLEGDPCHHGDGRARAKGNGTVVAKREDPE